jgi:hypothetical protein
MWLQASSWKALDTWDFGEPLAYVRSPLPWAELDGASPKVRDVWVSALVDTVIPQSGLGKSVQPILKRLDSSLELLVLPPANRFLPIPSMVISFDMNGTEKDRQVLLQKLVVAGLSEIQGSPATWLKFKDPVEVPKKGAYTEVFLPGGRFWIHIWEERVTLLYSSNMDFLNVFIKGLDKTSESSLREEGDLNFRKSMAFFAKPMHAFSFYDGWLKRVAPPFYEAYQKSWLSKVKSIELESQGEGRDFAMVGALKLSEAFEELRFDVSSPFVVRDADFWGGFKVPEMDANALANALKGLKPFKRHRLGQSGAALLAQVLGGMEQVNFSWSEAEVAPILRGKWNDLKWLQSPLFSSLGVRMQRNGNEVRASWGRNSLVGRIEGSWLIMSPLVHGLKDSRGASTLEKKSSDVMTLFYPLEGSKAGIHYTKMHFFAQTFRQNGRPIDPSLYPSFSEMGVKDELWKGVGQLSLTWKGDGLQLRWDQPHGPWGLLGGIKLQSASWFYFLSLIELTRNSF